VVTASLSLQDFVRDSLVAAVNKWLYNYDGVSAGSVERKVSDYICVEDNSVNYVGSCRKFGILSVK
jgi:hypothetical protein